LYSEGKRWIARQVGQHDIFLEHAHQIEEKEVVANLLSNENYAPYG